MQISYRYITHPSQAATSFVLGSCFIAEIMAPIDITLNRPTSPRPPQTPPGSPACTPQDSPRVHESSQAGAIDRFEHAVKKLIRALEKVDARNKPEDAKLVATKHIEAEKPKIRASKLEYKLVDEVYVSQSMPTISLTSLVQLG